MSLPLSGLPPLPASLFNLINAPIIIATSLDRLFPSAASQSVWGIFDADGNDVIVADTLQSFDYRNEWEVSKFPMEKGAFQSYNKVNNPFDIRVRFSIGGTESDRAEFLSNAQTVAGSLDLYSVVTPEITYTNCNIVHIDYHREQSNGAGMIHLDVWLSEIRESTTDTGLNADNTQGIGSADPISSGQIQAVEPLDSEIAGLA